MNGPFSTAPSNRQHHPKKPIISPSTGPFLHKKPLIEIAWHTLWQFTVASRRKPPAPSVMDSGSLRSSSCYRLLFPVFSYMNVFLALIGHFLAPYEAILAPYEGMLAPFEAMLAPCEPILGSCWAYVGPILTHFWPILAQIKNFDPF